MGEVGETLYRKEPHQKVIFKTVIVWAKDGRRCDFFRTLKCIQLILGSTA